MSGGALWVLFRNELRMLMRDTRTILIAVVAPLVLFPAMIFILDAVEEREAERLDSAEFAYAVFGDAQPWGRPILDEALSRIAADTSRRTTFREESVDDPDRALARLQDGDLQVVVEITTPEGWTPPDSSRTTPPIVPAFLLSYRAPSDFSRRARETLGTRLEEVRNEMRDSAHAAAGFPVPRDSVATVRSSNVASDARVAGAFLGLALTPFLILLMLSGGSIVAADAISGEKERGTLETLLTSAANRREVVRAKLLAVVAVGLAVAVVNLANLIAYATLGLLNLPSQLAVDLSIPEALLLAVLVLPLTVLVAAALLLLSGMARSYREYQTWFFPVFLLVLLPSLLPILPELALRSPIVILPISGLGVAIRDLLIGEVDLLFSGVALLATAGPALWLTRVTERTLSNERLISNATLDEADLAGGPALFPRHVLGWFLGFWVLYFVVSLWFGSRLGLRGQVVVNLVGIFFGGSLLVMRRYRLPLRETFRLRRPTLGAMLGAVIGAPAALVLGMALSEFLITWLFPLPEGLMEAMAEAFQIDVPLWQMLFFVAVLPAVFEELAFRGLLVRGLRGLRLSTLGVIVAGGLIFGVFHVSLIRIPTTAWLGMNLVAVVLLTRSIWPVVLWHFLNNALAIAPAELGWIDPEAFAFPWWAPLPAAAALALAWLLIWRSADPEARADFLRRRSEPPSA